MTRAPVTLALALALVIASIARGQVQQPYVFDSSIDGVAEPMQVGFDAEGRLLIAAGREGLIRVEPDGTRTTVAPGRVDRLPGEGSAVAEPLRNGVSVTVGQSTSFTDGARWPIGRLLAPEAAAIAPDGALWIADTGNARVVRVALDGSAAAFGERGFFPGQFIAPSGIAFDEGGPLVTDRLNHRVTRLAWDGSLRDIFGLHAFRPREGEGRIHYPASIAMHAPTRRIAVAEPFERRVQLFRPPREGEKPKPVPPMPSKEGVSSHFGPDTSVGGDIVAAWEPESGCVVLWDTRLDPPVHVCTFGGSGDRPSLFRAPASVLVEPDGGAVWVLDGLGDRLERWVLTRDTRDQVQFDPFMARLGAGIPLGVARSEAGLPEIGATDLVWRNGHLGVVFSDGTVAWTDPLLGRFLPDPRAARPRNDGGVLRAACVAEDARLLLLWSNGIEVRGQGAPTFVPLRHSARDPRGVLAQGDAFLVTDADGDALLRIDGTGQALAPIVPRRDGADRFDGRKAAEDGALWLPGRLAAGADGTTYVVDFGNHRLQRFGADGAWQTTFTLTKSRAKQKSAPTTAPDMEQVAREGARRDAARAIAVAGHGTLSMSGGGQIEWKAPAPLPRGEPFAMDVSITDGAGRPVEGVSLIVDCTMPHHGHGMNVRPTATQVGPGRWKVEPMLLHMPGRWELSFDLAWPDGRIRRSQGTLEVE